MFVLRTSESYDYHCSLMTGSLSEADSVTYGINYKSELNKLEDFHVCNNQLPQDVMHILLEGVIPYTVKAMLQSFICVKHFFTIDRLNQRISSFKFSRTECRSKPSPIPSSILHDDGSIHQSGNDANHSIARNIGSYYIWLKYKILADLILTTKWLSKAH